MFFFFIIFPLIFRNIAIWVENIYIQAESIPMFYLYFVFWLSASIHIFCRISFWKHHFIWEWGGNVWHRYECGNLNAQASCYWLIGADQSARSMIAIGWNIHGKTASPQIKETSKTHIFLLGGMHYFFKMFTLFRGNIYAVWKIKITLWNVKKRFNQKSNILVIITIFYCSYIDIMSLDTVFFSNVSTKIVSSLNLIE